jgi:hypothetical protein
VNPADLARLDNAIQAGIFVLRPFANPASVTILWLARWMARPFQQSINVRQVPDFTW